MRDRKGQTPMASSLLPMPHGHAAELLGSADLAPGSGLSVRATGVKSCEGEVRWLCWRQGAVGEGGLACTAGKPTDC